MAAPFNFGQLKFLKALTEALFDGAPMAITPDQVVANVVDLFAKVGGTKLKEMQVAVADLESKMAKHDFASVEDHMQFYAKDLRASMDAVRAAA